MTGAHRHRWQHILEAAEAVALYAAVGHDEFRRDAIRQDACVYRLLVIGEAATRLASSLGSASDLDELRAAADMRNFLIHEYWKTDIDVLWQAITEDIPRFAAKIRRIVDEA